MRRRRRGSERSERFQIFVHRFFLTASVLCGLRFAVPEILLAFDRGPLRYPNFDIGGPIAFFLLLVLVPLAWASRTGDVRYERKLRRAREERQRVTTPPTRSPGPTPSS